MFVNKFRRVAIYWSHSEIVNPADGDFRLLKKTRSSRFHDFFVRQIRFFVNKVVLFGLELDDQHQKMLKTASPVACMASLATSSGTRAASPFVVAYSGFSTTVATCTSHFSSSMTMKTNLKWSRLLLRHLTDLNVFSVGNLSLFFPICFPLNFIFACLVFWFLQSRSRNFERPRIRLRTVFWTINETAPMMRLVRPFCISFFRQAR